MIAADPMPPLGDDDVVAVGFSTGDGRRGWWTSVIEERQPELADESEAEGVARERSTAP